MPEATTTPVVHWFNLPPSPEWQWLGLVLAVISFGVGVTALPTVFQMLWGRPKIDVELGQEEYEEDGTKNLVCWVRNPRITSRFLRAIGVRRSTAESLTVTFSISESGSGKVIHAYQLALLTITLSQGVTILDLRASDTDGVTAYIVGTGRDGSVHVVLPPEGGNPGPRILLNPGLYDVELAISHAAGTIRTSGTFHVGKGNAGLYWA